MHRGRIAFRDGMRMIDSYRAASVLVVTRESGDDISGGSSELKCCGMFFPPVIRERGTPAYMAMRRVVPPEKPANG